MRNLIKYTLIIAILFVGLSSSFANATTNSANEGITKTIYKMVYYNWKQVWGPNAEGGLVVRIWVYKLIRSDQQTPPANIYVVVVRFQAIPGEVKMA